MFLAIAMIDNGGSHVDYCPNLPAGHILECMPSIYGILGGAYISTMTGLVLFVIGLPFVAVFSRCAKPDIKPEP